MANDEFEGMTVEQIIALMTTEMERLGLRKRRTWWRKLYWRMRGKRMGP